MDKDFEQGEEEEVVFVVFFCLFVVVFFIHKKKLKAMCLHKQAVLSREPCFSSLIFSS